MADVSATNGFRPEGVLAACITPFKEDESIDFDRLHSHYRWMLDAGIDGLMVIGGCGEYANLTPAERKQVVTETKQLVDGTVPVVVGALAPSTREALDVGLHAAQEGVSALLALPPYYIKPSFDGVVKHFETLASETGLPVIVYNIPGRVGWSMTVDQLLQLAEIPGVVALKECERDVASISVKISDLKGKLAVLSGDDDLGFATLLSGGSGAIWASPNLCPKLCVDLHTACVEQDVTAALALHDRLVHIFNGWMLPNHPGPIKEAMGMVGRGAGAARTPLAPMSPAQREALAGAIERYAPVE